VISPTQTQIAGVLLIQPRLFEDARGWFYESYHQEVFAAQGLSEVFVQDNHSRSQRGVLRGLHYQIPPKAQAKLVRVVRGEAFDVVVDLRSASLTRGQWIGVTLNEQTKQMLYVPAGCAHGFCAMTDETEVIYKASAPYDPALERGIIWNDPDLRVQWPDVGMPFRLSDKDQQFPTFNTADNPF